MTDNIDNSDRSLLSGYVEELSGVQSSVMELHTQQARLRNDIRTDGFNAEAVLLLAQIVSKSSHDGGLGLLRDIVKYAHETGIELDTVPVKTELDDEASGTVLKEEGMYPPRFRPASMQIDRRLVYLFQLGLGLGVAWMFLSLLR